MELPHMHLQMPFWLQRTAERAQSRAQASISDHISVRHETCRIETQDGFRVLKCEEIKEVFRLAHDGQKEIVEKTESTSIRPYDQVCTASSSGRYDEVVNGPLGPVVSATLGQMLDDFFQYAAELQHSLDQQDAASGSWSPWGSGVQGRNGDSSSSSPDSASRLFSWWSRRKPSTTPSSGPNQPSLQQLVRESSSDVQEI